MIEVKVDTSALEEAISNFTEECRKELPDTMKQQGGVLVGHVIGITPPGGGSGQAFTEQGGISLEAKKRGESRIAADIARIFPTTTAPEPEVLGWIRNRLKVSVTGNSRKIEPRETAFTLARMKTVHKYARNPATGRTRVVDGILAAYARPALLKKFIRDEQSKIGLLAAGWLAAADRLRTSKRYTPAWITRQGPRSGGADVNEGGFRIGIRIYNNQGWFPGDMSRRVQLAVDRRERGLVKALDAILERKAKAAERRMQRGG